jgi:hypothetical protein
MLRRYAATTAPALMIYVLAGSTGFIFVPASMHMPSAVAATRAAHVVNTITVINRSAGTIRRYPLQFGRPFIKGMIPHAPRVLLNGRPIPTQADVKNRYPDGSAEFAIIAVVIPDIRPDMKQLLTFEDTTGNSNTPLTRAQMLAATYNFDAVMTLAGGRPASGGKVQATRVINNWPTVPITNGGFTISVNGKPRTVSGINLVGVSDVNAVMQAAIARVIRGAVFDGAAGGLGKAAIVAPPGVSLSYTIPPPRGQDMGAAYNLTQASGAALTPPIPANRVTGTASARTMLQNGDYKLWTSGPVAQTIELADDKPSRKYDIGFGDGHHPFRPRFFATFWPQTHQVFVRAVGENDLTTELEDLTYSLSITGGANSPTIEERLANLTQPAMSIWTKKFWLGGTPNPEVDVDYNLAYLESTRFVPNYDTSVQISEATIARDYANWWTNSGTDINGAGGWQPGMGTTGARPDIGPEPSWDVAWLYTGDWRLRQTALGNADLAAQWPVNTRETDPNAILNRTDAAPVFPAVGTGYGRPISITYRTTLGPSNGGEADFLYYNSDNSSAPNKLGIVGNIAINGGGADATGWQFDAAHEPSPFFIPYTLTGDPFYLHELKNWAAYDATEPQGWACCSTGNSQGRGPSGQYGGADDQPRGDAWTIRSRAEAAFAMPDSDPFKTYLTILMNDDLARWEGAMGVTGTPYDGGAEKRWAQQTGNPEANSFTTGSPIGQWMANGTDVSGSISGTHEWTNNAGAYNDPWQEFYITYALGRADELGFSAQGMLNYVGLYLTGLVNTSGYPDLVGQYTDPSTNNPTSRTIGNWIANWPAYLSTYETAYLTGNGYTGGASQGSVPCQFNGTNCASNINQQQGGPTGGEPENYQQGYDAYAWAAAGMLVNAGVSGAPQAHSWLRINVYQPIAASGGWAQDPSWDILPRTDHNALPAQPTTPQ